MKICKECIWWTVTNNGFDPISKPDDPDTCEEMVMPFEVRKCESPNVLFCERPVKINGAAVQDGSTYKAEFYTAEEFGCILWEPQNAAQD